MEKTKKFKFFLKNKKLLTALVVLVFLASTGLAVALKSDETTLPSEWIGKTKVVNKKGDLTQVVFIKYTKDFQQVVFPQEVEDVGDPDGDGAQDDYTLIGFYWNLANYPDGVPYVINPSKAIRKYKLSEEDIITEVKASLESWDLAVDYDDYTPPDNITYDVELYNDTPVIDYKAKASIGFPDFKNVITWRGLRNGIIAVASIWYDTDTGEIVDADIILNSGYKWGIADGDESTADLTNAFDIRNIVTHEAGHWTGLDDIYNDTYWAMTMYGYSGYGEEIKRSLEPGDIAGAQEVYEAWRE